MIDPGFSTHFELRELAEGVFAAIAKEGGAAFSNAGIIDLGGRTLIFDTFDNPLAAEDLKHAAEQLTGRSADTVIISHYHPDHWSGNQVFADSAEIVTTHMARAAMADVVDHFRASNQVMREMQERLRQSEEQFEKETIETRRRALQTSITRQRYNLETLPTLRFHLPTLSFEGRMMFHGAKRTAELRQTGSGHTSGDCILLLPGEPIAFLGDLAFFHTAPYMGDCIPADWIARIDELTQMDLRQVVPGHGGLGTLADLELEKHYIQDIQALVAGVIQAGGSEADALQVKLPPPFDAWSEAGPARFQSNVRRVFRLGVS